MNRLLIIVIIALCITAKYATAQSFASLKKSSDEPSELYTAVSKTLSKEISVSEGVLAIASSKDLTEAYKGKTPIYLVMDFLAHHSIDQCNDAEQLLDAFVANKAFDINLRFRSLLPPFAYLIRENYNFLGGKFDANYISNHVLRTMIENGATINTYNIDGSTLMTFARETNNEYLQNYFIDNGMDLSHVDHKGHDEIYKTIDAADLPLLKKLVENARMELNIKNLKNDIPSIRQHNELYDYIATHCALKTKGYEELVLFRKKFEDKKELVQQKYEQLARAEADLANTYHEILSIEQRFQDLPSIIEQRKYAIYKRDCELLQESYKNCIEHAEKGKLVAIKGDQFPIRFISWYEGRNENSFYPPTKEMKVIDEYNYVTKYIQKYESEYGHKSYCPNPKYDPDHKLQLAHEVFDFLCVNHSLNIHLRTKYWDIDGFHLLDMLGIPNGNTIFNEHELYYDATLMKHAYNVCNKGSDIAEFNRFYTMARQTIQDRYKEFDNNLIRNIKEYLARIDKEIDREKKYRASQCAKCEIDWEKTTWPETKEDFLFGKYRELGRIYLKSGHSWEYDINNSGSYYILETSFFFFFNSSRTFETFEQMIDYFYQECQKEYCD